MPPEFSVTGSPLTTTGTLAVSTVNQSSNKIYASPADGSSGVPAFRVMAPKDLALPTLNIAASTIDWSLSNSFWKFLPNSATTFNFTNQAEGQSIKVLLSSGGGSCTVNWGTVYWPNGVKPVILTTAGSTDLYIFHRINAITVGTFWQKLNL
jgi:hypothetical protein